MEAALAALDEDRVTLSRAAEMADVSVWELRRRVVEADVTWVDEGQAVDDLENLSD